MATKLIAKLCGSKRRFSLHASLAALGPVLAAKRIFAPIHAGVQIAQKQVRYRPTDKLVFVTLGVLAGAKVVYDGDTANLTTAEWTQWNINLSEFGINLAIVTEVGIGFERIGASRGSGMILLDDIRLYRQEQ